MADFEILGEMRRRAFATLIPPAELPLSQWIEASIVLPEGLCAVPGPMRLYAYQRAIADAIGNPDIERVTLQKAARIGFSVLVAAAIGHYCGNDPSPILCLLPVESDCKDFVVSDLEPLFAASPALAGILREKRSSGSAADPARRCCRVISPAGRSGLSPPAPLEISGPKRLVCSSSTKRTLWK